MRTEQHPRIDDALDDLELAVARRADQLAQTGLCPTPLNLHCWLQAEQEILGGAGSFSRHESAGPASNLPACA
ncbi:MAG TPA: hypothetical protein VEB66_18155 [Opitutaceae bacterium]|nr:hypothetical protein [Opitutaceae bacterium]